MFLSYGFLPDGKLLPGSGISALKTNCTASQIDNTAGSIHANRQISLQNLQNLFFKASATLSITGFIAITSTGLPCFFFCAQLLFCIAALLFELSANGPNRFFNFNYFLAALPFFLFSMFFMFKGVLSVFVLRLYCFSVFVCFNVLACFMFLQ